jgi:insulysin
VRLSHKSFAGIFVAFLLIFSQLSFAEARQRDTKTLVLENGLSVLLIHDPEVHRSAAALAVGTGQIYDPKDKMGLAHYLEHMLFLGTKKFPEVGTFKKFLEENSGSSNAYTSLVVTNYFFQVSHEGFDGALDRFSQFFQAPLFDEKYSAREVNAVNSEHDKNKRQDGWRGNQVSKLTNEEGHPMRNFGTGNKDTLAGDNRAALLEFYEKYYSATNMNLVFLSKLSLAEQEETAKKYFGGIPNRPVTLPEVSPNFRKPLDGKYRLLKIKTIKDTRSLSLEFPTIKLHDYIESRPASQLGSVLGYEGKGSLLSKLKEEGLALGLSAGGGYGHKNTSTFSVSVSLTPKGEKEYERVLEIIFSYIKLVREKGMQEYTFLENQTMAKINFEWKNPNEGMGYVSSRASLMFDYSLEDVETLPYLFKKRDPAGESAVLETLTPGNALVTLSTQSVQTDKKEKYYGTEYSLTEVGGASFEKLLHPSNIEGMIYPEKNNFLPENLTIAKEVPAVIRDDEMAKVFYQFDNRFKQPKVFMKLRIETPKVYDSPANLARSKLYDAAVHEGLNEMVYPIQLAGLSYGLGIEKKGMNLTLGGYSERVSDLLSLVAKNLLNIRIDEQKFNDLKEAIIRGVQNKKFGQAYARAAYYNRQLWMVQQYNEEELLEGLKSLTLDDIKAYAKTLYEKVYITALVHGNWADIKARQSVDLLLKELNSKPLPEAERYVDVVEVLAPEEKILFSNKVRDNNNAIFYGLQVGEMSQKLNVAASLSASIVESDFYTQMRTNQQLGYIVWSFNSRVEDRLFFKMIIQSATYSPFEMQKRIEKWMGDSEKLLTKLNDEEFEKHRQALIVSLEKKGDSIAEMASHYYYFATEEDGNFGFKDEMVEIAKKITKEEVIATARKIFLDKTTPRLIMLTRSNKSNDPVPAGTLQSVEEFKNRIGKKASLTMNQDR